MTNATLSTQVGCTRTPSPQPKLTLDLTDLKPNNVLLVAPNGQQFFKDYYDELQLPPEISTTVDPAGTSITRVRSYPLNSPIPESMAQADEAYDACEVKITDLGIGMLLVRPRHI